jgi:hypothetical protein
MHLGSIMAAGECGGGAFTSHLMLDRKERGRERGRREREKERERERERERGKSQGQDTIKDLPPSGLLPLARFHLLKFLEPPRVVQPAGDQSPNT